jgi:NADH dehydrogenase
MIAVTGGSGFVGSTVVRLLAERGKIVRVLSRSPRRAAGKFPPQVAAVEADVGDAESLERGFAGAQAVVSAVQFPNHPVEQSWRGRSYVEVDGRGVERQVEAARRAGVEHFVYLSGAGTRAGRTEPWFRAKEMAERAVKESGLAWTIFRPSWIYGPGDRSLNRFAAFAKFLPFVPIIGSGRERVHPVYVKDVARAVAAALDRPEARNKTVEIGGPAMTMREVVETLLKALKRRRPVVPHPKPLMKLAGFFLQFLPTPPLSPAAVDFVTMEEPVNLDAYEKIFSDLPLMRMEQALGEYLA